MQTSVNYTDDNGLKQGYWEVSMKPDEYVYSSRWYKDGELHGPYIQYHRNGSVQVQGLYKDGKANGYWEAFYNDGNIMYRGAYVEHQQYGLWERRFLTSSGNYKIELTFYAN